MSSCSSSSSSCCKVACCTAPISTVECNGQLCIKLNDGNKMPMAGLGTWQSSTDDVRKAIRAAIKAGCRLIDTAFWYGNEADIGDELEAVFKEGLVKREDLFITTKLHPKHMGREHVIDALKSQLKNLKLSYVNLYLIHWPFCFKYDPSDNGDPKDPKTGNFPHDYNAHYTETWKCMEEAVRLGLTRSIGLSNFNIRQVEDILLRASIRPAVLQIESHPLLRNEKLIEYCQLRFIAITAFSTFANPGNQFAPTDRSKYPPNMLTDEGIKAIATKYPGKTNGHILLRWQVQRGVSVIPKSTSAERIKSNLNIFDFSLKQEDVEALNAMDKGLRICPFPDCGNSSCRDYPFDEYRDVKDAWA